mgnify:CR=1 FL=1
MNNLEPFITFCLAVFYEMRRDYWKVSGIISDKYYNFKHFFINVWKYRNELKLVRDWEGCVNWLLFLRRTLIQHYKLVESKDGFWKYSSPPKRRILEMIELCERVANGSGQILDDYELEEISSPMTGLGKFIKTKSEMPNYDVKRMIAMEKAERERLYFLINKYIDGVWD